MYFSRSFENPFKTSSIVLFFNTDGTGTLILLEASVVFGCVVVDDAADTVGCVVRVGPLVDAVIDPLKLDVVALVVAGAEPIGSLYK